MAGRKKHAMRGRKSFRERSNIKFFTRTLNKNTRK